MYKFLLGLIISAGALLRFYHLGYESFWIDEAYSLEICRSPIYSVIQQVVHGVLPPAYFVALHYWIKVSGISETALRGFSAVFGVLSIAMIYRLARLVSEDRGTALMAAFLLAVSPFHIKYAQEARMYTFFVFLALCSSYFFLLMAKRRFDRLSILMYLASSALMVYAHFHGFFVLIAQNAFLAAGCCAPKEEGPGPRKLLYVYGGLALISLPALFLLFGPYSGVARDGYWLGVPKVYSLYAALLQFSGSQRLFAVFIVLLIYLYWKERRGFAASCFSWCLFLIPLLLPWIISRLGKPVFFDRYAIVSSAGLYLLAASAVTRLRRPYWRALAVGLIIVLSGQQLQAHAHWSKKDQWREAAAYVDSQARENDPVVIYWGYTQPAFDMYSRRHDLMKYRAKGPEGEFMRNLPQLEGAKRVWLIVRGRYDGHDTTLREKYRRVAAKQYEGVEVLLYEQ